MRYAIDYELYGWWNDGAGRLEFNFGANEGMQLIKYENGAWLYDWQNSFPGYLVNYTGDTSVGLQTIEIRIPWDALGGKKGNFAVITWITGGSGSAVSSVPWDSALGDNTDEWNDADTFTSLASLEMFIPMPELTVALHGPSVVGLNRLAEYNVTVENKGSVSASNVTIKVYINGNLYANWTTDLGAGEEKWFLFNWTPNATGTYIIRAVVDEENAIAEANEDNNEFTMSVDVVWVGNIDVDGNPDDWLTVTLESNSYTVQNGVFIWNDTLDDQRHDKDPYLPGGKSSHADLTEVGVTKDDRYVYFLFTFADMSNIKIGDNGATFIAVPIDYKDGGAYRFAGKMDTDTVIAWDIQMAINLGGSQYVGQEQAVASAGNSVTSLLYFVDPEGNVISVDGALVGVDLTQNTIEVRVPLSVFEGARSFNFQVATGFSYGPVVWNFGDSFANDGNSDIVDTITLEPTTTQELVDNIPDYFVRITMDNIIESAGLVSVKVQRLIQYQNTFVMINKFYGIRNFERDYTLYQELATGLRNMPLTDEMAKKLEQYDSELMDLLKLYNEGKSMIDLPNYAFSASLKRYRSYTGLKKMVRDLEAMIERAKSGELEKQKEMEELAKNLTKKIDGSLDDWSVEPVAEDTTGFGQDGANLKALYVDYDDQFLYIALTTENKASWRIAYGISLDYKEGGYTTGQDSWARKVSFSRDIDAQLYFYWNGPFDQDKGTNNISSAQLVLWNGSSWIYNDLKWTGFYAYTGGENGRRTLEIAIPWKALGGKPSEIYIVAYVTGQGTGDSAVDSLPDDPSIHDRAPGEEWTDADNFTTFAKVAIE